MTKSRSDKIDEFILTLLTCQEVNVEGQRMDMIRPKLLRVYELAHELFDEPVEKGERT